MFHEEIAFCAEGEGGDGGVGAEEALVVAVVGYAVRARGVVVYEAEVVGCGREDFGYFAEVVEAVGDGAGFAGWVFFGWDRFGGCGVEDGGGAIRGEFGGFVEAEDGGVAGGVDCCFDGASFDGVLDAVEEELAAEEGEEVAFDAFGDEGLEVEEIEVRLVVNDLAFRGGDFG